MIDDITTTIIVLVMVAITIFYLVFYLGIAGICYLSSSTELWVSKKFVLISSSIPAAIIATVAVLFSTNLAMYVAMFLAAIAAIALYTHRQVLRIERGLGPGRHVHQELIVHHGMSVAAFTFSLIMGVVMAATIARFSDIAISILAGIIVFSMVAIMSHVQLWHSVKNTHHLLIRLKKPAG